MDLKHVPVVEAPDEACKLGVTGWQKGMMCTKNIPSEQNEGTCKVRLVLLIPLPLVALLSITGNNNVIFCSLRQYQFRTLQQMVKYRTC